jgi:sulfane dehydrogenase subunit SoxC
VTRFRTAWKWNGAPAVLKSRATDDTGAVQPTRNALVSAHGPNAIFHYNAIQAWQIEATGEVKNVYA